MGIGGVHGWGRVGWDANWDLWWQPEHYPSTHSWALQLAQAAQICTNNFADADPSSPIGVSGALIGVRGKISPYHELPSSQHLSCS